MLHAREYELLRLLRVINDCPDELGPSPAASFWDRRRLNYRFGKLRRSGWITQDAAGSWILTPAGKEKVGTLENWEFVVESAHRYETDHQIAGSHIDARINGTVTRGVLKRDDAYLIYRDGEMSGRGTVLIVSYSEHESTVVTVLIGGDIPAPGDVLAPRLTRTG